MSNVRVSKAEIWNVAYILNDIFLWRESRKGVEDDIRGPLAPSVYYTRKGQRRIMTGIGRRAWERKLKCQEELGCRYRIARKGGGEISRNGEKSGQLRKTNHKLLDAKNNRSDAGSVQKSSFASGRMLSSPICTVGARANLETRVKKGRLKIQRKRASLVQPR